LNNGLNGRISFSCQEAKNRLSTLTVLEENYAP
jgi:hypothetical protein